MEDRNRRLQRKWINKCSFFLQTSLLCVKFRYYSGFTKVAEIAQQCPPNDFKTPSSCILVFRGGMKFGIILKLHKTYHLQSWCTKTRSPPSWIELVILMCFVHFIMYTFDQTPRTFDRSAFDWLAWQLVRKSEVWNINYVDFHQVTNKAGWLTAKARWLTANITNTKRQER